MFLVKNIKQKYKNNMNINVKIINKLIGRFNWQSHGLAKYCLWEMMTKKRF